jgi:hypothetical protein
MMRVPFLGGSGAQRSVTINAERTVNLYPALTPDGKSPMALYGTPGLARFAEMAAGAGRGLHVAAGRLFAVVGGTLYEIQSTGAATARGTLSSATAPVSLADNGQQLVLVDGSNGYSLTLADNVFAGLSATEWSDATHVAFHDGYFVLNRRATGQFLVSSLYGTDVDALDFATAEGAPDSLAALLVDHRELWLFGESSTEVWYNSGAADFPFARLDGAFLEVGCVAPYSPAKADNAVFWLAQDRTGHGHVMRAQGYQPQIVSTRAVEHAIQGYGTIADARGYTYQQDGHSFYVLTFPSADRTWAYDAATQLWHERMWWDGAEHRHRGECYAFAFGRNLVLDHSNGLLYGLDLDVYTDDGATIRSIRRTQHQHAEGARLFWAQLQVDMESGVGLVSGQGSDPQAMLRWSDDGGHTWSSEHWRSMGRLGEYRTRAIWRRLGQSRDRVYELTVTDPVKRVVVDAWADVEVSR